MRNNKNLPIYDEKCTLNLKYSKRTDHVTDDVMPLFWSMQKLLDTILLSYKFSLLCDKMSTLYSPQPSLQPFSPIVLLNFKCRTSTGYLKMPHTTKTSNRLFVVNSIMTSSHSNEKSSFGNSHLTDDVISLGDMGRYFMANVTLLCSVILLRIKL